jgi:putative tryptophan/tyrosine transport system substrate-binding protein
MRLFNEAQGVHRGAGERGDVAGGGAGAAATDAGGGVYLNTGSRANSSSIEVAFREGLGSMGFVEGRSVAIDYRYTEYENDRLPELAADLVRRQVTVIYAVGTGPAVTAKAATTMIPIVFRIGGDPVQLGLVTSLNRPDGNMTGVSRLTTATGAIRVQMLHEAVPKATVIGLLVNPTNPTNEPDTREAQDAARKLGLDLHVVGASNAKEIDAAFATSHSETRASTCC